MALCEQKANSILADLMRGTSMPIGINGKRFGTIPMSALEPHAKRAERNHCGQTLKVLAERGGLSPLEAIAIITDRSWREVMDGRMPADSREDAERQRELEWQELQSLIASK